MTTHWKELLPVDHYQVRANGVIHPYDQKIVTALYQPLVGAVATSCYWTLWNETHEGDWSAVKTHRSMMNRMQLSLDSIYEARKRLEGIGLLETYVEEREGQERCYYYHLQPPVSPHHFFNDGMLNIYLYNQVGKRHFHELKRQFMIETIDLDHCEKVTASFNDVFTSIHLTEMRTEESSEMEDALKRDEGHDYVVRDREQGIHLSEDVFDYALFYEGLSSFIVPKQDLTEQWKEGIIKLAYIYKIEPLEMQKLVEHTFMTHDEPDLETLRKDVQEWYLIEHDQNLPSLSRRTQPELLKTKPKADHLQTDEDKMIHYFETTSPYDLLQMIGEGSKPASSDLKLVEQLMFDQKIPAGVVNVLIDYVMRTNDLKLIKAHVEKIAAHWKRKNIQKVPDAMALAKAEHRKYQDWQQTKKKPSQSSRKKSTASNRQDHVPTWISGTSDGQHNEATEEDPKLKEKKAKLEERLKNFRRQKRE